MVLTQNKKVNNYSNYNVLIPTEDDQEPNLGCYTLVMLQEFLDCYCRAYLNMSLHFEL